MGKPNNTLVLNEDSNKMTKWYSSVLIGKCLVEPSSVKVPYEINRRNAETHSWKCAENEKPWKA